MALLRGGRLVETTLCPLDNRRYDNRFTTSQRSSRARLLGQSPELFCEGLNVVVGQYLDALFRHVGIRMKDVGEDRRQPQTSAPIVAHA
ncbi:hypothetical protein XI09_04325 [Bradyrhizobium sp. CCBAU 11386]|nr:hypothetical protein [Bradyrhizobium sp. CCBAU 11386]